MWWTIDDALEYVVTMNSVVFPSRHLLSQHRSVFWISRIDQIQLITNSVRQIVIQGCVGRGSMSFNVTNLPSLSIIEMGYGPFCFCNSIVLESMNDWMNDEWDLNQLQSIILGWGALDGDDDTVESNELIMKSMNDIDYWLIRSLISDYIQRRWLQYQIYRQSDIG